MNGTVFAIAAYVVGLALLWGYALILAGRFWSLGRAARQARGTK